MNASTTGFLCLPILPKFDSANQFKLHNSDLKSAKVEVKSFFFSFCSLEQWQSWKFETEKDLTSIKSLELHDSILWLEVHSLDNKYTCTLMPLFYWRNFSPKDFAMIFMYFLPVKTRGNMVLPTFISNLVMFLLWFLLSWELRVSSRVFCNCTV